MHVSFLGNKNLEGTAGMRGNNRASPAQSPCLSYVEYSIISGEMRRILCGTPLEQMEGSRLTLLKHHQAVLAGARIVGSEATDNSGYRSRLRPSGQTHVSTRMKMVSLAPTTGSFPPQVLRCAGGRDLERAP
jgi:hypothetical protein